LTYEFNYGTIEKYRDPGDILLGIYRLRFQVYVKEWGFEAIKDHPDGLEHDDFDDYSVHTYACCDQRKQVIGTVRMILNSPLGFPIERYFDIPDLPNNVDRNTIGEISRLAISKEYRRRIIDNAIFGDNQTTAKRIPRFIDNGRDFRRHCEHELVRGLYIALYRDSKLRGLTHWYAVMAQGLYIILKRWGIIFKQIGPARDYHGLRAPYLISVESMESSLSRINPVLYCDAQSGLMHLDQGQFAIKK
jgi:N-acyl amino acid synthase of PEP-CTERM/exosortase system